MQTLQDATIQSIFASFSKLNSINEPKLDGEEKIVFDIISSSPISVYEISFKSCLPISKLNSVLTILELNGYIKKLCNLFQ